MTPLAYTGRLLARMDALYTARAVWRYGGEEVRLSYWFYCMFLWDIVCEYSEDRP